MKNIVVIIALILSLMGCSEVKNPDNQQQNKAASEEILTLNYPETVKGDVVDSYFDQTVADPYRWLEDDRSEQTGAWVEAQNAFTSDYLQTIPYREQIKTVLTDIINYEKVTAPFKEGGYVYFYRNDGLQNQYVLYRHKQDESADKAEVFIDPNTFSEDGTTSMSGLRFSPDGSLAAYQISTGGSDWREIVIIETASGETLEAKIQNVKFSGIAWRGNQGFYYSSYAQPDGSALSAKTDQHVSYFHKLGTEQQTDQAIFGLADEQKHRYVWSSVSEDGRYLVIYAANSTSGNKLYLQDLSDEQGGLVEVLGHTDSDTYLITSEQGMLYLHTNLNAPNGRLVKVSTKQPTVDNWQDVIPHQENVLSSSRAGNYLFAHYMVDAISKVQQFDLQGKLVREITLPGAGSADGFSAKIDETEVFFSFDNYVTPPTIYKLDLLEGEATQYRRPQIKFDADSFVSQQVFFNSQDGTPVPMIISYHKDTKLDGNNPTILYGYGGFDVSLTPYFSSTVAAWLKLGGIYAVANIRGGGEYGKAWHQAGTQMQKQNVFDDFIAAAEYLIAENYTKSGKLAMRGGSNGGLLVGAVMNQRPELFQVALPAVGVLDMLRYHTFTAGAGWAHDYGTSEQSKEMFEYLLGYSPLHNVRENTNYPATLITTADHDDRVVPAHSFKFAAELQSKQTGSNPTLIRIETKAGHGAGKPTSKIIEEYADIYGFTLFNMGYQRLPNKQ
jgi:prolyl oligopeptidase